MLKKKYHGNITIFHLDKPGRLSSGALPVKRFGVINGKDWDVKRQSNPELALCFRYGPRLDLDFGIPGHLEHLSTPHLSLTFPGQSLAILLHAKCNEVYFTYDVETASKLFDGHPPAYPQRVMLLEHCPEVRIYFREVLRLLALPLSADICTRLDLLALLILSASFWRNETKESNYDNPTFRIEHQLSRLYHDPALTLERLAKSCNMSVSTLRRVWGKFQKITIHQWIMERRNYEARELLSTTTLPIYAISEKLGFSNQLYFSTFFRNQNGCSPLQYRQNQ